MLYPLLATALGLLTVTVQDQPYYRTIPPGAQHVSMMTLDLHASCDRDVTIYALNLQRRGLGAHGDIDGIYAVSGYRRLSRSRAIARSDGGVQLRLRHFTIPACSTQRIQILADFSRTATVSGEHRLELDLVQPIETDDARIQLQSIRRPSVTRTAGRVQGAISLEYRPLTGRITVGRNEIVSRIQLRADSRNHQAIASIRFKNDGSAKDFDLQNLYLETSRRQIISRIVPYMDRDTVTLVLDPPLILEKNNSRTLQLRADVVSGGRKTIKFIVEEPSDIQAFPVRRRR